jgi:hypothetical protein
MGRIYPNFNLFQQPLINVYYSPYSHAVSAEDLGLTEQYCLTSLLPYHPIILAFSLE